MIGLLCGTDKLILSENPTQRIIVIGAAAVGQLPARGIAGTEAKWTI
jgi:hypothetical protein